MLEGSNGVCLSVGCWATIRSELIVADAIPCGVSNIPEANSNCARPYVRINVWASLQKRAQPGALTRVEGAFAGLQVIGLGIRG